MAGAYSSSKAAVIGMTKAVGKDVAGSGVLVNCIAPAVIDTPILGQISEEHIAYMTSRIPLGADGRAGRGRGADLLARERGDDVLDRRVLRHLRRPGHVLTRFVRAPRRDRAARRPARRRHRRAARPRRSARGARAARATSSRRRRSSALELLPPIEAPEIWCAGVTYERSRDARLEEAETDARDVYALVYDAERPELFLKDARCGARRAGRRHPGAQRLALDRARARARRRDRRGRRAGRGDDRQRRLEPGHRGREPALHPPGEDLRGRLRDRPGARRAGRLGAPLPDPAADHRRRRCGAVRRRDVDGEDEAHTTRARRVGRARQPGAAGIGAADGHRARPAGRVHARAGPRRSRSRSTASACSSNTVAWERYGDAT